MIDWTDFIQTVASFLLPVLALVFKVYTDKQKLETQAMITENRDTLINLIDETKKDLTKSIGNINDAMIKNQTADEYRDKELVRLDKEIQRISKKIFNGQ